MRTPGKGSSMVQAPPTRVRLSSTRTRLSARARYAAQAGPLWPAPTITTSQRREANSRTGAGNPISPRAAAVEEITALVSTLKVQVGKQAVVTSTLRKLSFQRVWRILDRKRRSQDGPV